MSEPSMKQKTKRGVLSLVAQSAVLWFLWCHLTVCSAAVSNNNDVVTQSLTTSNPPTMKTMADPILNTSNYGPVATSISIGPDPSSANANANGMLPSQGTNNAQAPAQMMVSAAPAAPTVGTGDQAFANMAGNLLPLTPEQINKLRRMFEASQQAAAAPGNVPPKPSATTQNVVLSPGATPPAIRLAQGFVSSVVFLDSTGAPWPIEAYDIGNPQAFNVQWNQKDNTLLVQATTLYTYGNMAVRLKNLSTPVMLTLIPGQKAVDYRVDLRIQGLGPQASTAPPGLGLPEHANTNLLTILDNVPPPGSIPLAVNGGDAQAWVLGDKMFLRTRCTILSPSWLATVSSADGMHVYEMMRTPIVVASHQGQAVTLRLDGF